MATGIRTVVVGMGAAFRLRKFRRSATCSPCPDYSRSLRTKEKGGPGVWNRWGLAFLDGDGEFAAGDLREHHPRDQVAPAHAPDAGIFPRRHQRVGQVLSDPEFVRHVLDRGHARRLALRLHLGVALRAALLGSLAVLLAHVTASATL